MNKTELVEVLIEEGYYNSQSGAYKAITNELNKETIYLKEENILKNQV